MKFEWDPRKDQENQRKHGVTFQEATTVFGDSLTSTIPEGENVRIISAREANAHERKAYES